VRYGAILALGVIVVGLSGCGGAKSQANYSVPQVETAFTAHGLPLRQARFGPASGIVKLRGPGGLEVDVDVAHKGMTEWLTASAIADRNTSQRNLIVTWAPRYTKSVNAALRQLRSHA
jgi:hypothetical protein